MDPLNPGTSRISALLALALLASPSGAQIFGQGDVTGTEVVSDPSPSPSLAGGSSPGFLSDPGGGAGPLPRSGVVVEGDDFLAVASEGALHVYARPSGKRVLSERTPDFVILAPSPGRGAARAFDLLGATAEGDLYGIDLDALHRDAAARKARRFPWIPRPDLGSRRGGADEAMTYIGHAPRLERPTHLWPHPGGQFVRMECRDDDGARVLYRLSLTEPWRWEEFLRDARGGGAPGSS